MTCCPEGKYSQNRELPEAGRTRPALYGLCEVARCNAAFSSPSSAPAAPLMPVSDTVHERFIRLPEVMHLCGLSRSTIYDLISREAFPKQISLGGKNVAWAQSEITAWMADRIAERNRGYDA